MTLWFFINKILEKGDMQMGDKERDHEMDLMFRDIANIIAEKCVHPDSKRPFSLDSIKNAMKFIHFPIKLNETPKKQAITTPSLKEINHRSRL